MEIIQDIKKGIKSAYVEGPFDKAKEALENKGYEIISLEQMAQLRIKERKDSFIFKNGNWTREGFIYVPKKGVFFTKNSPIMANAVEATECHRNADHFYLTSNQVEKALADSCEITNHTILTSRLSEEELTAYAFGSQAKAYGEFLNESGIEILNINTAWLLEKPYVGQAWFREFPKSNRDPSFSSFKGWCEGDFIYYGRVRGVKKATSKFYLKPKEKK